MCESISRALCCWCSWDSDSQGKIFIGLLLNVILFGINVTQTYIYYIHSKKCVYLYLCRDASNNFWMSSYIFISGIDCGSNFRWANGIWIYLSLGLWTCLSVKQVAIIFVADVIQPMVLSIYLYRTLIVNFGMHCYFCDKPFFYLTYKCMNRECNYTIHNE